MLDVVGSECGQVWAGKQSDYALGTRCQSAEPLQCPLVNWVDQTSGTWRQPDTLPTCDGVVRGTAHPEQRCSNPSYNEPGKRMPAGAESIW